VWPYPYSYAYGSISQRREAPPRRERSFSEDLLQANIGRRVTVYLTFDDSEQWRNRTFTGTIRQVGRDYFVIREQQSGRDVMVLNINLDYVVFEDQPARLAERE